MNTALSEPENVEFEVEDNKKYEIKVIIDNVVYD